MRECGVSDPRTQKAAERALDLEFEFLDGQESWNAIAERMADAWSRYSEAAPLLKRVVRARGFFAEMWKREPLWVLDAAKLAAGRGRM